MAKNLPWRKAIEKVLEVEQGSMHYKDIAEKVVSEGLRTTIGATPAASVNSAINTSIREEGDDSPFQGVGKGEYILKKKAGGLKKASNSSIATGSESRSEVETPSSVISSFGMYWRRDRILWVSKPRVLGMQQIGAEHVDFNEQNGIYLLYDSREVIYVGRTTDRPLGRRLFEHTVDRLSTRWDRFSWFGLLPVSEKGKLGPLDGSFEASKIIPAFEAILIEALEPRQNRKRGDDLSAVEYFQKEDPEIDIRNKKALLAAAIEGLAP